MKWCALQILALLVGLLPSVAAAADQLPRVDRLGRDDLWTYRALDAYQEPPFVAGLVADGQLPRIEDRLPPEPLVFGARAMHDGIGTYGGVFRHVTGGRPEGFNWMAGHNQGWGGLSLTVQECLVRNGPLWQVHAGDEIAPLPNLVRRWNWNADRTEVTMDLVAGVKWSDGDPFDTDDIAFWWHDNVQDPQVAALLSPNRLGAGTTLEVNGPYQFTFHFDASQRPGILHTLAFPLGCPGPSHLLRPLHPKHNPQASYTSYRAAQPPDKLPVPTLSAWVPVQHIPDQSVVLRRNPYYWKVDEVGQQLPYMNEVQFALTGWSDRLTNVLLGTADMAMLRNMADYEEIHATSLAPDEPAAIQFGPMMQSWHIALNYSGKLKNGDFRKLFRTKEFRIALTHAIDRNALSNLFSHGTYSAPFAGGLLNGSPYYDPASVVLYPFNPDHAARILDDLGLTDRNGDGYRQLPSGQALEFRLIYERGARLQEKMSPQLVSNLRDVGIKIVPVAIDGLMGHARDGAFDMMLHRPNWGLPTKWACNALPVTDGCPLWHLADDNGTRDLMEFEASLLRAWQSLFWSRDPDAVSKNAKTIQHLWTENAYTIGLIQSSVALLINKRVRNVPPHMPPALFQWPENAIIRERLWVPPAQQLPERRPNTIPHQ